jgi:phosphatidylglycerophosphatase C
MEKKSLALFDFDNTLSICDSFLPFILFVGGPARFSSGLLRLLARRLQGPIGRREAKQILAEASLKNFTVEQIKSASKKFAKIFLPLAMNPLQVQKLEKHIASKDRVIIVSASPRIYLEEFANQLGTELIGTELVEVGGVLTGEISGENCRGAEKVTRINLALNFDDYSAITAYGDSDGDKEMLEVATIPVFRWGREGFYSILKPIKCLVVYTKCLIDHDRPN